MSWGTRRRNMVLLIIAIIVFIPLSFAIYLFLYEEPTCFDGKQNGSELGVDCGGACELLCKNEVIDPIVLWSRYFTVGPGVYNALAYVENPNPDAGIEEIGYTFKLYNSENVLIQEKKGMVRIPPKAIFPITENGLFTNQLRPTRVSFEFDEDFIWKKSAPQKSLIQVRDEILENVDAEPRLTVELENTSILIIKDIDVVAILYDENENAVRSSTTFIKRLDRGQRETVVFTWPAPFDMPITKIEVIPLYEIDA